MKQKKNDENWETKAKYGNESKDGMYLLESEIY